MSSFVCLITHSRAPVAPADSQASLTINNTSQSGSESLQVLYPIYLLFVNIHLYTTMWVDGYSPDLSKCQMLKLNNANFPFIIAGFQTLETSSTPQIQSQCHTNRKYTISLFTRRMNVEIIPAANILCVVSSNVNCHLYSVLVCRGWCLRDVMTPAWHDSDGGGQFIIPVLLWPPGSEK